MFLLRFFGGLMIVAIGALIIMKREWFLNNFGRMEFFEEKLGLYGGSRLAYLLVGLIAIFIGFSIAFGLIGNFMGWLLGPLIRYQKSI
jgi:hypothetical protein